MPREVEVARLSNVHKARMGGSAEDEAPQRLASRLLTTTNTRSCAPP